MKLRHLVLLGLLSCVCYAQCPQGTAYADGCSGAPTGTIQYPHIQDGKAVFALAILSGSGYTNGTYTWTSTGGGCSVAASGTVTVSGGLLGGAGGVSYTISSEGSGCTSQPTIPIPAGAGSGTGGSITATVYQVRVPWNAPGVDYHVGVPSGTTLVDPTVPANLPSGATFSGSTVSVTGTNVTLNGFDFTLHDTSLSVSATSGTTTVENSKFVIGTNQNGSQSISWSGAGNLTILNSELDGSSLPGSGGSGFAAIGMLISNSGAGNLVWEYNYCHDVDSKCFQVGGSSSSGAPRVVTEKYNLFTNISTCASACSHGEAEYFFTGSATFIQVVNQFNTYYDNFWNNGSTATSIAAIQADNLTINGNTVDHNIWMMPGPQATCSSVNANRYTGSADQFDGSQNDPTTAALNNVTFAYNYLDGSGVFFNWYHATKNGSTNSGLIYANNVDLGAGGLCNQTNTPLAAPTASPVGGTYTGTQSVTLSVPAGSSVVCWSSSPSPVSDGSSSCPIGTVYTGPISVSSSETLYWVAGGASKTDSAMAQASYVIAGSVNPICSGSCSLLYSKAVLP